MTFPLKFRQHVLAIGKKEHLTFAQTAERFGVGIASVMRWAKNPQPKMTRHKTPSKIHTETLLQDVAEYPDAFPYERAERPGCSARGICDALRRLGMTRKKSLVHPAANADARRQFQQRIKEHSEAGKPVVYIDDTKAVWRWRVKIRWII